MGTRTFRARRGEDLRNNPVVKALMEPSSTRDVMGSVERLAVADNKELALIAKRDPDMIRDMAKDILKFRAGLIIHGRDTDEE